MRLSLHLDAGHTTVVALAVVATSGLAFSVGGISVLRFLQGANQLSFAQILAIGAVLGLMPTTVTLWVIRILYDVKSEVAKLHDLPQRVKALEDANAGATTE